jgi:hypothetical protein
MCSWPDVDRALVKGRSHTRLSCLRQAAVGSFRGRCLDPCRSGRAAGSGLPPDLDEAEKRDDRIVADPNDPTPTTHDYERAEDIVAELKRIGIWSDPA